MVSATGVRMEGRTQDRRTENLLPLDTSRVQAYLDTVNNLDLKDYVNYKVTEEELADYGLKEPELSVAIDYTKTEEETEGSFVLHIGRDPSEQEAEKTEEESGEDNEEEEVTAYARIGDSKIIYQLTAEQYQELKETSYDSLRHQELFWADFSLVYQLDIALEGKSYTLTSREEDKERVWYYRLHRYDGNDCIAVVDGETVALVERSCVVDLIEAVNSIVLE